MSRKKKKKQQKKDATPKLRRMCIRIGSAVYNDNYWKAHCLRLCDPDVVAYIKELDPYISYGYQNKLTYSISNVHFTYLKIRKLEINYNNKRYFNVSKFLPNNDIAVKDIRVYGDLILTPKSDRKSCIIHGPYAFQDEIVLPDNLEKFDQYKLHAYKDIVAVMIDNSVYVYTYKYSGRKKKYVYSHCINIERSYEEKNPYQPISLVAISCFCDNNLVSIFKTSNGDQILVAWDLKTGVIKDKQSIFLWLPQLDELIITNIDFPLKKCDDVIVISIGCIDNWGDLDEYGIVVVFDLELFLVHLRVEFPVRASCLYFDAVTFIACIHRPTKGLEFSVHKSSNGEKCTSRLISAFVVNKESVQVVRTNMGFLTVTLELYILNKDNLDILVYIELTSLSSRHDVAYLLLQHNLFAYSELDVVRIRRIAKESKDHLYELIDVNGQILRSNNSVNLFILNHFDDDDESSLHVLRFV